MRIAKYLSSCGIDSRRKSEELIKAGLVTVNDNAIKDLAFQVEPTDVVKVKDKLCVIKEKVYYAINKPAGFTSTVSDKHANKLVTELVPETIPVWPVGRLDKETKGLLLLTNDGELTQKLTHPSFEKEKEYLIKTSRKLTDEEITEIQKGIKLDDGEIIPDKFNVLTDNNYSIVIHSGKNRIIRRIFEHFNISNIDLTRIRIGNLKLEGIESAKFAVLSQKEIKELFNV